MTEMRIHKLAQAILCQDEVWHGTALEPKVAEELARQVSALCEATHTCAEVAPFEAEPADFTKVLSSSGFQKDAKDG